MTPEKWHRPESGNSDRSRDQQRQTSIEDESTEDLRQVKPLPSTRAHLAALASCIPDGHFMAITRMSRRHPDQVSPAWRTKLFSPSEAAEAAQLAAEWDEPNGLFDVNVYVRTTAIGARLKGTNPDGISAARGGDDATSAIPALFIDLDLAKAHPKSKLKSLDVGLNILRGALGGDPTLLFETGGGAHAWYLLEEPVTGPNQKLVSVIHAWRDGLKALAEKHGTSFDRPDASRILRVAGTHRRKPESEHNRVIVHDLCETPPNGIGGRTTWRPTRLYDADELINRLPALKLPEPPQKARSGPMERSDSYGPADAVGELTWAQILEPHGWVCLGDAHINIGRVELWRWPGSTTGQKSITAIPDGPAYRQSTDCGMPADQWFSKWDAFVILDFKGDESEAARQVRRRSMEMAR